jgi:NAD(P)-dependent dehydrogenase (short-subunit alcohol dehydrogenase family)
VALVFGAGSFGAGWGNGKAAAVAYAREGAAIVSVDIELEKAEETAAIIRGENGRSIALAANVVRAAEVRQVVERTMQEFGRIDILHNNVGISHVEGRTELNEADWHAIVDSNLKSVYLTCEEVLPIMVKQRYGVITNISSIASIQVVKTAMGAPGGSAVPSLAVYSAAKAGLNQFSRTIAVMYAAQGIRCNVVLPGNIDTPRVRGYAHVVKKFGSEEAMLKARDALSPTGKMGTAWDIANAAVFLASAEANYLNGVILPVDASLSCT